MNRGDWGRLARQWALAVLVMGAPACASLFDIGELPSLNGDGGIDGIDAGDDDATDSTEDGGDPNDADDGSHPDAGRDAGAADATSCSPNCPIEILADNLGQGTLVAVDSNNIYFGDESPSEGAVYQCPKAGCGTSPLKLGVGYARSIVSDGTHVYWNSYDTILSCTIGGCANSPTPIGGTQTGVRRLAYDGAALVWATGGDIRSCPTGACGSPSTVASNQGQIAAVAAESGTAYWISDDAGGTLRSCSIAGCTSPLTVGSAPSGVSVAVRGGVAYWTSGNSVVSCATAATTGCGSGAFTLGSSSAPQSLAVDESDVYWYDLLEYTVNRCPRGGCVGTPAMLSQQTGQASANVALDGEYVYWTTAAQVLRRHK